MKDILKKWKEYSDFIDKTNDERNENCAVGCMCVLEQKSFSGFMDYLIIDKNN